MQNSTVTRDVGISFGSCSLALEGFSSIVKRAVLRKMSAGFMAYFSTDCEQSRNKPNLAVIAVSYYYFLNILSVWNISSISYIRRRETDFIV